MYIKSSGRYAELTQETEAFDTIEWTIANRDIEGNEEREFASMIEVHTVHTKMVHHRLLLSSYQTNVIQVLI